MPFHTCMKDVTRSTMPASNSKTFLEHAEELLARFQGVDRANLLLHVTALYLMDFKYGNKREELAACDFLNLLQAEAVRQAERTITNDRTERRGPATLENQKPL